jgi:Cu-Zn family superoxide dismutase
MLFLSCVCGVFLLTWTGCADADAPAEDDMTADTKVTTPPEDTRPMAAVQLQPTQGHQASGSLTFSQDRAAVRVSGTIRGLTPGTHGFHVHQTGDCSAPDASSAGGHYAPQGSPHGAPSAPPGQRHVGDLGNIEAGQDGMAMVSISDSLLALSGPNSIVGKAVIVHANADDLTSQPTGDAGPRVACGVIE